MEKPGRVSFFVPSLSGGLHDQNICKITILVSASLADRQRVALPVFTSLGAFFTYSNIPCLLSPLFCHIEKLLLAIGTVEWLCSKKAGGGGATSHNNVI